ncbi:MAG: DUF2309 domain-containing protein [Planctomycetota bacterium]|nr:DUF2309 domain-containing protein [Planctomycetota bacterium]
MQSVAEEQSDSGNATNAEHESTASAIRHAVEHAAHLLPSQGPITVFVHHNTLHAFEDLSFDEGVKAGSRTFGCHPYLPEDRYRAYLEQGRIRQDDLSEVLIDDLEDSADYLIGVLGTRHRLRLGMLQVPLQTGPDSELRWVMAETDARKRFRTEVSDERRSQFISQSRRWVMRHLDAESDAATTTNETILNELISEFGRPAPDGWNERKWEAFVLEFLWRVSANAIRLAPQPESAAEERNGFRHRRLRDSVLKATGQDTDEPVHEVLTQICAAFLDQGFAHEQMPARQSGLFAAFLEIYSQTTGPSASWRRGLAAEIRRVRHAEHDSIASIDESLTLLGVVDSERDDFITQSLLALRGWAGMVWQMETNAEWALNPAPAGTLLDFLAVRLILERVALTFVARESLGFTGPLAGLQAALPSGEESPSHDSEGQRTFRIFQLAQFLGWNPESLQSLSVEHWTVLLGEIESFSDVERRRIFHLAYERKYRNQTLDALAVHTQRRRDLCHHDTHATDQRTEEGRVSAESGQSAPSFQIMCCIDDREESFRRHLEEIAPDCETFGIAGFYGVAMYYQGVADAHFTPLCPVNVTPSHYVTEESVYSQEKVERRRADRRRRIGKATRWSHMATRSLLGGVIAGMSGSLATFPLVIRTLFPRVAAQIRREIGRIVQPPATELRLERLAETPAPDGEHLGFSVDEMAAIVAGGLCAAGLVARFAKLIIITGHGSGSLNNPHESAYNCGACSGGRGGPNARAFAQMANDPRVRRILGERDLHILDATYFVGAYHNTCDDSLSYFDLDRLPITHRQCFEETQTSLIAALERNAHERCRRFESAELTLSPADALTHVESRSQDLSQARPEYNHATNGLCFVGRREWSRGLFLDRRAFLTSYDPELDDENCSLLEGILQAVIPVCAGISLEYYFSTVDTEGYGCGSKLPHNITSLLGVMTGAASDLKPGLSAQMVEIHEPVRILFVIETTPDAMLRIIEQNPAIKQLCRGDWVQLATIDAESSDIRVFHKGVFKKYIPESDRLPEVHSSTEWYSGQRVHLGFASIIDHPK